MGNAVLRDITGLISHYGDNSLITAPCVVMGGGGGGPLWGRLIKHESVIRQRDLINSNFVLLHTFYGR